MAIDTVTHGNFASDSMSATTGVHARGLSGTQGHVSVRSALQRGTSYSNNPVGKRPSKEGLWL